MQKQNVVNWVKCKPKSGTAHVPYALPHFDNNFAADETKKPLQWHLIYMNADVDFYFTKAEQWHNETNQLRSIVLSCGLTEELKWGCPCYTFHNRNIVLIHTFKAYCALLFFKGALLHNANGILVQQTKNVQAARQIRFTGVKEIIEQEAAVKACVYEAVEVEKAGLRVAHKQTSDFSTPEEFMQKLTEHPQLKTAFAALTPGRQRAYLLYFSSPKQSKTRTARIEKHIPNILKGKGLND